MGFFSVFSLLLLLFCRRFGFFLSLLSLFSFCSLLEFQTFFSLSFSDLSFAVLAVGFLWFLGVGSRFVGGFLPCSVPDAAGFVPFIVWFFFLGFFVRAVLRWRWRSLSGVLRICSAFPVVFFGVLSFWVVHSNDGVLVV